MLRLERYGVVLRQIGPDDIEQVRLWRNDPEVARYMAFRDHITPEMQQRWYEGVTRRGDLYFIIQRDDKDIGVSNLKDIDLSKKDAEAGIFIVNQDMRNSLVPYLVNFCLFDFAFDDLGLQLTWAHILDDNIRAIRFNKSLGFQATKELQDGTSNRKYFLEKSMYFNSSAKIKKIVNPYQK